MAKKRKKLRYVMISKVAERYEIHPQTLRLYEREGLLEPQRSAGNTRLYDGGVASSARDHPDFDPRYGSQPGRRRGHPATGRSSYSDRRPRSAALRAQVETEERDRRSGVKRRHALVKVETVSLQKIE